MAEPSLTREELLLLAAAGGTAPSLHNSQPWRFRPTADARGMEVCTDLERAVPLTDPEGRALHISVGAAVFNIRVAAVHLGREPLVRLFPSATEPHLVAVIDLARTATSSRLYDRDLYQAIAERHSSRRPFANRDVPEAVIGELIAAAREEGVVFSLLEEDGVRRVLSVTAVAERRTNADLARMAETNSWLRLEEPATDGIPSAALGPRDREARVPMRTFTGDPSVRADASEHFEALPQLATLATQSDLRADWVRAGQAMQRVWLLATAQGLRASVLHQAVEWPETRRELRDPAEASGHIQLVLRLGYGPPGSATPRRPVAETLDTSLT